MCHFIAFLWCSTTVSSSEYARVSMSLCEQWHFRACEFVKIFGNNRKDQVENTISLMQMLKELNSSESILLIAYIYLSYAILHTIYHRFDMHMNKQEKWFDEMDALNFSVFLLHRTWDARNDSIHLANKIFKMTNSQPFSISLFARCFRSLRSNVDISSREKLTFDKKRVTPSSCRI